MSRNKAYSNQVKVMENVLGHKRLVGAQSVSQESAPVFIMQDGSSNEERSDITYFGTGIKEVDGDLKTALYVQRKEDLKSSIVTQAKQAAEGDIIIEFTDLVETTPKVKPLAVSNELHVGKSIGHTSITAGTLGLFVKDNVTNQTVILSNNHVLANNNLASIGDPIISPGPADKGTYPNDHCGDLIRYVDVIFGTGGQNFVDGAICSISSGRSIQGNIVTGVPGLPDNSIIRSDIDVVIPNDNVFKMGRTTGATSGIVTDTNVHVYVDAGGIIASYSDQIAISSSVGRFSAGGDSGSAIINANCDVVGLLFAGTPSGGQFDTGITYANPIQRVFDELNIRL